jgi:hypothetical protein
MPAARSSAAATGSGASSSSSSSSSSNAASSTSAAPADDQKMGLVLVARGVLAAGRLLSTAATSVAGPAASQESAPAASAPTATVADAHMRGTGAAAPTLAPRLRGIAECIAHVHGVVCGSATALELSAASCGGGAQHA